LEQEDNKLERQDEHSPPHGLGSSFKLIFCGNVLAIRKVRERFLRIQDLQSKKGLEDAPK